MTSPRKRRPVLSLVALGSLLAIYFLPVQIGGHDKLALTSTLVRAAGGETVTLTAPVTLSNDPEITIEKGSISIESSDKTAGLATLLDMLRSGGANLVVDDAVVMIGGPRRGSTGAAPAATTAAPGPEPPGPWSIIAALEGYKFETLKLRRTLVRLADGDSVTELGSIASDINLGSRSSAVANGVLNRNGQDVAFKINVQPSADAKDAARSTIRAHLSSLLFTADFDGHVARGSTLQLSARQSSVSVKDVVGLATWLGEAELAGAGFRTFSANGPFEWSGSSLAFQSGDIVIDGNAAVGSLSIAPSGDRVSVEGTLDFARLDLAPYLGTEGRVGAAFGSAWLKSLTGNGPGVSFIESMDADLRISASDVVVGSQRLGRGAAALAMKDGRLNANIAEIELSEGGSGEGVVAVDMRGDTPRYKVSGELRDLDTAWAGKTFFDSALLDGQFAIVAPDAATMAFDLDAIMATANTLKAADPLDGAWRKSAVKGLNVRLQAINGLLTTETAELATDRARFKAAGTLDLRNQSLDVSLARSPAGGTGAIAGYQNVRVRGAVAKPAVSTDAEDDRSDSGALNGPSQPIMITLH